MRFLKQSTAVSISIGHLIDEVDQITPITSLTPSEITAGVVKGVTNTSLTLTASGGSNDFVHIVSGLWSLELTTSDTDTLGQLRVHLLDADKFLPLFEDFQIVTANVYDSLFGSGDNLQTDMIQIDWNTTNGNNATLNLLKLNIVNSGGDAIVASSTGSNGNGINSSGNGTGAGMKCLAGASGNGIYALGGATSGAGIRGEASNNGAGIWGLGALTSSGILGSAAGINADGIEGLGSGTGHGFNVKGGATGHGMLATGGATSGDGIQAVAATDGDGFQCSGAGGSGKDINASQTDNLDAAITTRATPAQVNTECDTALSDYDSPTKAEMDTAHALLATPSQVNAQCDTALSDYDSPTKAEMDTAHALLATPSQVNTQVDVALGTTTYAELSSIPGATSTLADKINWLFEIARNKMTNDGSNQKLFKDDGSTTLGTAPPTDSGGTSTRGEYA